MRASTPSSSPGSSSEAQSRTGGAPLVVALRWAGLVLLRAPRPLVWGFVILHASGIWMLSSVSDVGPEVDSWIWSVLGNAAHAPLFGILGLFLAGAIFREERGWARLTPATVLAVLALVGGYGALDEWHQSFVPGRHPSPFDLVTDLVGGACVLWIVAYLGAPGRSERGLYVRLGLGVLLCFASAALASFA